MISFLVQLIDLNTIFLHYIPALCIAQHFYPKISSQSGGLDSISNDSWNDQMLTETSVPGDVYTLCGLIRKLHFCAEQIWYEIELVYRYIQIYD